jgi:diguanylate cyclase (GGDEF)-like protein/PAS domain S-box-containing protein
MAARKPVKKGPPLAGLRRRATFAARMQSERRQIEKALRESQDLNQAVLSSLTDNIAVLNRSGDIIAVNDAWKRFAAENGAPEMTEKWVGMNYLEVCSRAMASDETASRAYAGIHAVLEGDRPLFALEYPCHSLDHKRWFLLYATPLKGEQGGGVISHVNITERKLVEEQAGESEMKMRALLEGLPHGIYECDTEGRIIQANEAFARITGYSKDEILRMHIWDFMEPGPQQDSLPAYLQKLVREQPTPEPYQCRNQTREGRTLEVQVDWVYRLAADGTVTGFFCLLTDITERKRIEEKIRRMATTDTLTGLPNRTLFIERFRAGLNHAHRTGELLAVVYLDLDDLKGVNDTLGHAAGDQLLVTVGERLRSCVRNTDTVARIGGDEYNLLLAPVARREDVITIAEKIVTRIREPILIGGSTFHMTASLGVSLYPDNGEDAEILLEHADIALYHVKTHGKNGFTLYDPAMRYEAPLAQR